jgi:hypothetical protein
MYITTAEILRRMEATLQANRKNLVSHTKAIMQQSFLKQRQDYFFALAQLHAHGCTYTHQEDFHDKRPLFCSVRRQLQS